MKTAAQVHEDLQTLRGNIRVICRARPPHGTDEGSVLAFPLPGALTVSPPDRCPADFEFNACYDGDASQVRMHLLVPSNALSSSVSHREKISSCM